MKSPMEKTSMLNCYLLIDTYQNSIQVWETLFKFFKSITSRFQIESSKIHKSSLGSVWNSLCSPV